MVSVVNSTNNFQIDLELRKRHEKTILKITENDLINNQDKILSIIKKECVDFSSWFYIILYYYSKGDYASFHKFSEELSKADIEQNPFYKSQKIFYIHILSILSFFYSFISQKSKDKTNYSNYSSLSTSLSNHSEKVVFAPINLICKGFLYFTQGDYDSSDTYFSNISTYTSLPKNIVIVAKLGRALNAYNQNNFNKSIEFLTSLINDYNYINENVLESIGLCYYNANNLEKAKEIFEKIVEYYPNNYKVKTYLAVLKLGNIENQNEKDFNDNFNQLINAYKLNNYSDVSIPILLINLCNVLLLGGKYDEAGKLCKKLNDQLDFGEIKFNLENNDNNNKKKKNYRKDYNEIRSAIYTINAKYLILTNNKEEGLQYFQRAVQENKNNIEAQFGLGQIHLELQNFSNAEKCFITCKKIMDDNKKVSFKVLKYLAYILSITKRKEIEKIIELYKQAIAVKNDDIDCYIKLAELLSLKSPEDSIKYYQEAIKFIKENEKNKDYFQENIFSNQILPEILNNMACILLRLGKVENVEEYLKESKKLIKEELKKIDEDEKEKKLVPNEKKIRLNALNIGVDFNYALYYESRAMFDYAHFLYKKIIKENPYFIEAYIKLCDLYKMRGNKTKAEYYIKLAIDKHFTEKKEIDKNEIKEGKDNEKENNKKKMRRLISIMNKPVNPMLIEALIFYESGKENEAIIVLNQILQQYSPHDTYTLIFLANIYYNFAIEIRNKNHFREKLNHAIELYFRALEYDKYNAMAAIGLCNCLCEYNYTDKALEIYKTVIETMENNTNAFINESFIYMNDKKFAKASIILHKVLKKLYNGKNPVIENLLGKCYIETKEFSKANKILKNLMMRFPDVITYKFNYGTLLIAKSQEKLSKNDRKVRDTEEAIQLINRAEKIFEMINKIKRDEKEERILKNREFYYKCSEMITVCSSNLSRANDNLKEDQKKESEMNLKIENNIKEYNKKLEYQKQNEEINKNKNVLSEENYNRNKELEAKLTNMIIEDDSGKGKKGKKKEKKNKKDKNKNEKEELNEEKSFKEKKKKKKKLHKKKIDESDEEELQNENEELQNENRELQDENEENDENENNNNKMVVDDNENEDNEKMEVEIENINEDENEKNNENENKEEENEEIKNNENEKNDNVEMKNEENENNEKEEIKNEEKENSDNEEMKNEENDNEEINNDKNEKEEIKNEDN